MLIAVIACYSIRQRLAIAALVVMTAIIGASITTSAMDLPPVDDVVERMLDAADETKSHLDFAGWMASPLPGPPKTTFLVSRRPVPPAILPQTISILTPLRC
jgi:hypothetical protein